MSRRLKILCLHGYRQDAEKFHKRTGGVRKYLKELADFSFISAPHEIEGQDNERGWWFTGENSFSSLDVTPTVTGFDESVALIKDTFKCTGPFDGILGFSQGAAFAAILCSLKQQKKLLIDFKFVMLMSGFKSECTEHSIYYSDPISIPSLHLIGETDARVDKSVSEELANVFVNPVIVVHKGGHCVPTFSTLKQAYREFVMAQQKVCCQ